MKKNIFFVFIFFINCTYTIFPQTSIDSQFRLSDAVNSWKAIEKSFSSLHCVITREMKSSVIKKDIYPVRIVIDATKNQFVVEHFTQNDSKYRRVIDGKNEAYCFTISNTSEQTDLTIGALVKTFSDEKEFSLIRPLFVLWSISTVPILEIVSDTSFEITSVRKMDTLWSIDFTIHSESKNRTLAAMRSGNFLLDPNANWAIKEYKLISEYQQNNLVNSEGKSDYIINSNFTSPIPVFFTRTSTSERGNETESYTYLEYKKQDYNDDKIFTLSAFGLPEPDAKMFNLEVSAKVKWIRFIIILLGSLMILISLAIKIKRNSKALK
ncbi:MAG: hypothetical protein LBJ67_04310 [Planctomycetaceae bacterium]|jgi:hypothetical protein|nr:hypothetical protein [Planctomycetaceae bacterium]